MCRLEYVQPPSPVFGRCWHLCVLQAPSSSDFFDREKEQTILLIQLKGSPTTVLVIVGPRSRGKSRLLKEVLAGK